MRSDDLKGARAAYAVLAMAMQLSLAHVVRAELPEGCTELGLGLTDHTCFHARFGPFVEVTATPGTTLIPQTPNIDAVHTHFTVALSGGSGVVSYTPKRTGDWSVFHDPDIPLRILTESGTEPAILLEHEVQSCPYLPRLQVQTLTKNVTYRFVFGPSSASQVVVVNEYVEDFVSVQSADADGDGYGDANGGTLTSCLPPSGFVIDDSDCDDADPNVHPGRRELCDGIDENCNLIVDDIGEICWSGSGPCRVQGTYECAAPDQPVSCSAAPLDAAETETCNAVDDDCDGTIDDGADALCATSPDRPRCVSSGNSKFCGCEHDADCGGVASGRVCFLRANEQRCIEGCILASGRNGCPEGLLCTSLDPAQPGVCTAECGSDAECAQLAGRPRCDLSGASSYCVECLSDGDCAGRLDNETRCIGAEQTCAQCSATDDSACDPETIGGACLANGRCGCNTERDCAGGRRCDTTTSTCDAPEDPGMPVDAGSDGSQDDGSFPELDAALDSGSPNEADAEAPSDDAAVAGDDSGPDAADAIDEPSEANSDGCGCRIASSSEHGRAGWLGAVVLLVALRLSRRHRRRARQLASVALVFVLGACSRSYVLPSDGDQPVGVDGAAGDSAGHGHDHDDDHDHDLDASHDEMMSDADDGSFPGTSRDAAVDGAAPDAAFAEDGAVEPTCVRELGIKLVAHSCQHVDIGPLVDVSAAVNPNAIPEAVSASHTAYLVHIEGARGALSYRPSRPGLHAIMTGPTASVAVFDSGTGHELALLHEQPIEECPIQLTHAAIIDLEAERDYRIVLGGGDEFHLFIEHVETFGRDAWTICEP